MKKVFLACALALAGVLAFGQSSWKHSAGAAVNASFYSLHAKDDGFKNAFVPQLSARYYGEAQNGFCVSGTLSFGWALSKNFKLDTEDKVCAGLAFGTAIGAGYAFHFSDRWTFALLGTLSFDWMFYKFKKTISAKVSGGTVSSEWTQEDFLFAFGIGCEAIGIFPLTKHFSMCGTLGLKFFDAGKLKLSGNKLGRDYSDSFEIRGNIALIPSFGVVWTF